jgi:hypothetical protein
MQRVVDNRYTVLKALGSGGVGEVFLARDEVLGREVAVKILSRRYAGDEEFVERFKREARSTALLSHPNIVSVYDLGETHEVAKQDAESESAAHPTLYITMEYVRGSTLAELIRERGPLPPETAAEIALRTAAGLMEAHERGIVHRAHQTGQYTSRQPFEGVRRTLLRRITRSKGHRLRDLPQRNGAYSHGEEHHNGHGLLSLARAGHG